MERQVCQSQIVSTEGFTPESCAQFVPNGMIRQNVTERNARDSQVFANTSK